MCEAWRYQAPQRVRATDSGGVAHLVPPAPTGWTAKRLHQPGLATWSLIRIPGYVFYPIRQNVRARTMSRINYLLHESDERLLAGTW
ncbi:MAG: hypothetical protein ACLUEU_01085 [Oscillospiraceae bacterium]